MVRRGCYLFGQQILCVIVSFFMLISVSTIFTYAFGQTYVDVFAVYGDNERSEFLYSYREDTGPDILYDQSDGESYELREVKRRDLSDFHRSLSSDVSLALSLCFLIVVLYSQTWKMGNRDLNMVQIGRQRERSWTGLAVGGLSNLPALLIYLLFAAGRCGLIKAMPLNVYRGFNMIYYGWVQSVFGSAATAAQLSGTAMARLLIPLLVVPAVSWLGYLLGYKDLRLLDRLMYKKTT